MTFLLTFRSHHLVVGLSAAFVVAATWHFAAAQEAVKNFVMHGAPKAVGVISFQDDRGQTRSLADFKGKVVLLNIWATWCGPCRLEMPALDRLQATLGGPDFEVVPISIDRGGMETVRKFYSEIGLRILAKYIDASGQALRTLGAVGLPTTLLIDRAGREIGRIIGPAEWDTPEIAEFLKSVILKQGDVAGGLTQDAEDQAAQPAQHLPNPLGRWFQSLKALFIR